MNIEMLSNFSILKSFNDGGRNILDSLMPFLEHGIASINKEYIDFEDLKETMYEICYLDIPTNTLKTLLKRLKRKGILTDYENWKKIQLVNNYSLNTKKYNEQIEASTRDINKLSLKCKEYCHFDLSLEEVMEKIFEFISLYQQYIDFSGSNTKQTGRQLPEVIILEEVLESTSLKEQSAEIPQIVDYIIYISKFDNENYQIFKTIFFGFLLRQLVASGFSNGTSKIKNLTIYADTNFILRIIDMQSPPFVAASKELLNLIKEYGLNIVTFPEIVYEIRAVLSRNLKDYIRNKENLIALHGECSKQLDGVIGSFFRRDLEFTEIADLIDDVENIIKAEGIAILSKGLDQELKFFEKEYEKIVEFKMEKHHLKSDDTHVDWKIDLIKKNALIDVKILEYIRKARKSKKYSFESCEHVLLTCDNILYKVNSHYHKQNNSISESLCENCLTDTLFLCNPKLNSDASIKLLISMFQTSEYLDYDILSKFHNDLQKYIRDNPKEQKYLGYIFNNQNLFNELKDSYDSDDDIDSNDYIVDLFIKAKQDDDLHYSAIKSRIHLLESENNEYKEKISALSVGIEELSTTQSDFSIGTINDPPVAMISTKHEPVYVTFKILIGLLLFTLFLVSLLIIIPRIDFETGFDTNLSLTLRNLSYFLIPIFIIVFSVNLFVKNKIDTIIDRMFGISGDAVLKVIGKAIIQSLVWILVFIILGVAVGVVGNIIYNSMSKQ
jgi:predicted nucleic acid-binding protein